MSSNDGQIMANTVLASGGGGDEIGPRPEPQPASPPVEPETEAKKKTNWWRELRAIALLILAVLGFHSLIAKPFYIPSESMMPNLLVGDRLVVSKYPYGWSWVSPTFHILPQWQGRLFGSLPERGDIVIAAHPGDGTDYIKRVIGLPGDRLEMTNGELRINGVPVRHERRPDALIPVDPNLVCMGRQEQGGDGTTLCRLPIVREILPNGRSYDIIDFPELNTDFAAVDIPENHVWLMGDNRDHSADSRFPLWIEVKGEQQRHGLGGPVAWELIGGRAEFITFSLDGTSSYFNPISWFTALRGGRAGASLHPEQGPAPQ